MNHEEFVSGYRAGRIAVHVNRSRAMHVCGRKELMPGRYRFAHHFWKGVGCLMPFVGIVSLFILPWWIGLSMIALGFFSMAILQRTAAQFVLEHALEDAAFFEAMRKLEVIRVSSSSTTVV